MKRLVVVTLFVLGLFLSGGCDILESQRMDPVETLSTRVDNFQEVVAELKTLAVNEKLISEELGERIDEVSKTVDTVQTEIEEADYVEGDSFGNTIKTLQAANTGSAPLNPYAVPIGIGLTIVAAISEGLRRREKSGRTTVTAKRTAEKAGIRKTITELSAIEDSNITSAMVEAMVFKNIGDARSASGTA